MQSRFLALSDASRRMEMRTVSGTATGAIGMTLSVAGIDKAVGVGERCLVHGKREPILSEVVGFQNGKTLLLPFGTWDGVAAGAEVVAVNDGDVIFPDESWRGRIIDAHGNPIDGQGPLKKGSVRMRLKSSPPTSYSRKRVGEKLRTGVKAMDVFTPVCRGQRLGIFAGSGVGKSSLLSMLARNTTADVVVIGLIGERGREVQEFIQEDLGPEGLKNAVVVVSTGDQPALMRRQAGWCAMAVAEYYRDRGKHVLLLLDSVTRFATAQREIGLSGGEPPAQRGFTPTVFTEMPKLLERAGPGEEGKGDITGLFTVLVDGDDMNEPIADLVRGILDGHIILDRKIAERGRYPAVNTMKSISRMLPHCHTAEQYEIMVAAKRAFAVYDEMSELIKIGAYVKGTTQRVDAAIDFFDDAEKFLMQKKGDSETMEAAFSDLYTLLRDSGALDLFGSAMLTGG